LLYVVSDWILNRIEIRRGARFENRSLVFFLIILVLALVLFNLIQQFRPPAGPPASGQDTRTGQVAGDGQR
jgi:hypothetical protein